MKTHRTAIFLIRAAAIGTLGVAGMAPLPAVTFESLLHGMADLDSLATFPDPAYECLQASSYNRLSTARDQPSQGTAGWFADSDGTGFIRTETINGQKEWVVMEHTGPGALTRFWTPYFYYSFGNRTGPNIRIYLDGSTTPVIDQNFIELLSNLDWATADYGSKPASQNSVSLPAPFANFTARAGVLHLPIPFARSCKVTMSAKPFYNTISYRTYPAGTTVQTFTAADLSSPTLATVGRQLTQPPDFSAGSLLQSTSAVPAGGEVTLDLPAGASAVRHLEIVLDAAAVQADPTILRSLVLSATFDGVETLWCPVGDFFCSPDRLNNLATRARETDAADGKFVCRWVMPYQTSGTIRLLNLSDSPIGADLTVRTGAWTWDANSLHFHANWRADDVVPGTPFLDWNFIDIQGKGVLVGDTWTVLNLTAGWWGEGDEKIYIDDDYVTAKFPSHFGTGTEDYYGWAGGVNPTRNDVFATPLEANVQVGSTSSNSSQGFNVNSRTRVLDAIPFHQRLVFDMEASAGTGQRNAWDLLMYSAVVYWYARPGATSNRPPQPAAAAQPITSFDEMRARSELIKIGGVLVVPDAIEGEDLIPSATSPGLIVATDVLPAAQNPGLVFSSGRHLKLPFIATEQFAEFRLTEQFTEKMIRLRLTTAPGHGRVNVTVNEQLVATNIDLDAAALGVNDLELGTFQPADSAFTIRLTSTGAGSGGGFAAAVDAFVVTDPVVPGLQIKTDFDFSDNAYQAVFNATPFGAGPAGGGTGALRFDGTTALQASTATVFGGAAPADNYGYEIIVTPSALDGFDIMAGIMDDGGANSSNFLFQQAGAYRLIEAGEASVPGTTAPVIGTTVALAFVMDGGTGRLFVNRAQEASRVFTPGGSTPISTASLEAVILGGNLFDAATGAFNGTIKRFRAFTFDPRQFEAGELLGSDDGEPD